MDIKYDSKKVGRRVRNGFKLKGPSMYYRLLYAEDVINKPNGNHKWKTTNKYSKNKEI